MWYTGSPKPLSKYNFWGSDDLDSQGYKSHKGQIKDLLTKSKVDYLTLNESWLNFSIDEKELEISGFNFHRFDRDNGTGQRGGGGILTYYTNERSFVLQTEWNLCCPDVEWTWIKLNLPRTCPTFIEPNKSEF